MTSDIATTVVAVAAAVAAIGYLIKQAIWLFRTMDVLERVVSRELQHNGGNSMKDRAAEAAVVGARIEEKVDVLGQQLQEKVDSLAQQLQAHISEAAVRTARVEELQENVDALDQRLQAHISDPNAHQPLQVP